MVLLIVELICRFKSVVLETEPQGGHLADNIALLFGRHPTVHEIQLAAAFVRTNNTILRGCITLREFPVIKAR